MKKVECKGLGRRGGFKDATTVLKGLALIGWQKLTLFINPSSILSKAKGTIVEVVVGIISRS